MRDLFSLRGLTALITGGPGDIGRTAAADIRNVKDVAEPLGKPLLCSWVIGPSPNKRRA
jgi:hypothetical protein